MFWPLQGKLTIKHERVSLPEVVDDVVDLCRVLVGGGVRVWSSNSWGLGPGTQGPGMAKL